ncbi:nucleoside-diphosphate-sugar epimerase [Desulfitobacterium dehalogenans ATCC 51507]|uniref:Nucleoside-diphosphate-sugar epimerase n=1 Tax=Desulfitobacterium dehalogenans (strain ATCC 51507 / DSM 9161 / JW/IU-DC1) TaxID=756499 RepID=I4ACY6_DESDJ|nr:NAD(P)-dependent oxidoreductase [Desulfitobacterium dehalogenans]AFM01821.1 nucleoside-diphosphate-sugar epimerase [Desulfitobacterium dehalogenans ATCC 51507]
MKKVVVTGANGFVGSALVEELVKSGVEVTAIVRNEQSNCSRIKDLPKLKIVFCPLDEIRNLAKIIVERHFDVFYHFAWEGSAGTLRSNYELQLKNVQYSCDAVIASRDISSKKFVLPGSIMGYECAQIMSTQNVPGSGNVYSAAKLAANYMARTVAAEVNIDYVVGTISNIYGMGEISPRFVNTTLRKFLSGERTAFTSGEQIYDFIYITDAAKAFNAIGECGQANKNYYIGSIEPKPLKDFLKVMRDRVDPRIPLNLGEIQYSGVPLDYSLFDLHLLNEDTGFVPEVSFEDGIDKTIAWLKDRKGV